MDKAPPTADPRLRRLLGGAELDSVRQRLRRHFERAEPGAAAAVIRLGGLDPAAYRTLCQLTGRSARPAHSMTLDIVELDAKLAAAGLADSLRDALERLDGPIVARAQLRRELEAQWSALAISIPACPALRAWLDTPAAPTLLKRLGRDPGRALSLLTAADRVLRCLPAKGQPRSQLAAQTLGDAHGLDAGRPIATLVLAAWRYRESVDAARAEMDDDAAQASSHRGSEERQRDIWARAGILVNELARPALLLNLPVNDPAQESWRPGEPAYLSLRQLLRMPPAWSVAGQTVFVCENPNLLAIAADQLGRRCAPLVCTDGMPAAAQRTLLDQLLRAGAQLRYHGDFDWPGLGIANFVVRAWQASPWRLGSHDYEAAVRLAPVSQQQLGPAAIIASWDARLAPAMQTHGIPIAEEAVAATLLDDLLI